MKDKKFTFRFSGRKAGVKDVYCTVIETVFAPNEDAAIKKLYKGYDYIRVEDVLESDE